MGDQPTQGGVEPTGFGGLSSLVSDVDGLVARARARGDAKGSTPVSGPVPRTRPATPSQSHRGGIVGSVLAVGFLAIVIATAMNEPRRSSSPVSMTPPPQTLTPQTPRRVDATTPPTLPVVSPAAVERRPPVGTGLSLDIDQIRYCLSEDIRLEAAREVVEDDFQVVRFNGLIDDWNSRCSNYRYRRGLLETVTRQVEGRRAALVAEGRARFR